MIDDLRAGGEVIFGETPQAELTVEQCFAMATSHYFNINVLSLPSVVELTNAGRVSIVRDLDLRTALVEYEQRVQALSIFVSGDQVTANNLLILSPDIIRIRPVYDSALGEMQTLAKCDVAGMREDQMFQNALAENLDAYDAYLRDGLLPLDAQLAEVHRLVDLALEIKH